MKCDSAQSLPESGRTFAFWVYGVILRRRQDPILENQMEKEGENNMEAEGFLGCTSRVLGSRVKGLRGYG